MPLFTFEVVKLQPKITQTAMERGVVPMGHVIGRCAVAIEGGEYKTDRLRKLCRGLRDIGALSTGQKSKWFDYATTDNGFYIKRRASGKYLYHLEQVTP